MTKISINLLRWSTPWNEVQRCVSAVLNSDFEDFTLSYTENPHESAPSLVQEVQRHFGDDSRLRIHRNESNIGYAGAHNRFFAVAESELLMVLNPDAIIDASFLGNIVKVFSESCVGAATGKMLKPQKSAGGERILDGTGIEIYRSRRARERGQLEPDRVQYDNKRKIFGVSGTAAVYRKTALEAVKLGEVEYFDQDFFAYWEDFDLSWRLRLCGFECVYVPEAIVEHGRAAGASPGGVKRFLTFVRHHKAFPLLVRQWSWRNHLFAIVKNDFGWSFYRDLPLIILREIGMFFFILTLTPSTLTGVPKLIELFPTMIRKRQQIARIRTKSSRDIFEHYL